MHFSINMLIQGRQIVDAIKHPCYADPETRIQLRRLPALRVFRFREKAFQGWAETKRKSTRTSFFLLGSIDNAFASFLPRNFPWVVENATKERDCGVNVRSSAYFYFIYYDFPDTHQLHRIHNYHFLCRTYWPREHRVTGPCNGNSWPGLAGYHQN